MSHDPQRPALREEQVQQRRGGAFVDLAVGVGDQRGQRLRGSTRLHMPTVGDPLLVVVVDEAADAD
jgi:hypothetical protein